MGLGRITIHIGAGKCGSTAIQSLLTRHPVIPRAGGGEATHVVIERTGRLLVGPEVRPGEHGQSRKSAQHGDLLDLSAQAMAGLRRRLAGIAHPVMSSEYYFSAVKEGREFLGRLGLPVHVVAYVRPQVDYVNSAYWQWDAWTGKTREEWTRHRIRRSSWAQKLQPWRDVPEVEAMTVRLLPADVVTDVLEVLGAVPGAVPPMPRANPSLPGAVLRFLQRHPDLREAYAAELIWVLPEALAGRDLGPVPWLVDEALAARIVAAVRRDNERLLSMLDPASAERMRADPRWWDPAAYAGRVAEPMVLDRPDAGGLDALAAALFEAVLRPGRRKAGRPAREPVGP